MINESKEAQSIFSSSGMVSYAAVAVLAVPTLFVLFVPENPYGLFKYFQTFVLQITSRLPGLRLRAEGTSFPHVAVVANCMYVVAAPCVAVIYLIQTTINYPEILKRNIA